MGENFDKKHPWALSYRIDQDLEQLFPHYILMIRNNHSKPFESHSKPFKTISFEYFLKNKRATSV